MAETAKRRLINELMVAITDLQNATDLADQAISDSLGLNRTDARCLSLLITHGPVPAGELARGAGLTPGALTFAVDRLEKAGYAQRVRTSADRRRVVIEATAKAQQLADDVWAQTLQDTEQQLAKRSVDQLRLFNDFVHEQTDLQRRHATRIRDLRDTHGLTAS
jgi:DNA-binding MarR family transcriptional regulator